MDTEQLYFVNEAAAIADTGRSAALNTRIEALAENPGAGNGWWVHLFGPLASQVFGKYLSLKRTYSNAQNCDAPLIAWRSRNLLELSIWSTYCAKSRENARRVYEDAGRDAIDIYDAFIKWGEINARSDDWFQPIATAKQDLTDRAKILENIEYVERKYKRVEAAASECGLGEHYSLVHKLLSKFAHPTAMRILANPDEVKESLKREISFSQGCLYFSGAFNALEGQLLA
jgi:hypothetical protein